jgi:long-chain acyl-CoA synthetase
MGAISNPDWGITDAIGPMESCIELKLVSVPSMNYVASSSPPQGEIFLRGPSITTSYFNRPSETQETFTVDGWMRTGDIGEMDQKGMLRVIDRKKNLIKTLRGEYIALEKVV